MCKSEVIMGCLISGKGNSNTYFRDGIEIPNFRPVAEIRHALLFKNIDQTLTLKYHRNPEIPNLRNGTEPFREI